MRKKIETQSLELATNVMWLDMQNGWTKGVVEPIHIIYNSGLYIVITCTATNEWRSPLRLRMNMWNDLKRLREANEKEELFDLSLSFEVYNLLNWFYLKAKNKTRSQLCVLWSCGGDYRILYIITWPILITIVNLQGRGIYQVH